MNITFKEKQKFSSWALGFITALLIPIGLLFLYGIYQQIFLGEAFGDKPAPDIALILLSFLVFGLLLFFLAFNLQTEIDKIGIRVRMSPFIKRELTWAQITKAEIVDYGFIGGWGIRFTRKYGTAYNAKGKIGIAIQLKSGKRLLIGTQRSAEVEKILKEML